jgi:hypothetical protein
LTRGEVSLALVQRGSASESDRANPQSLGSLLLEAVWVFTPRTLPIRRLNKLAGKRARHATRVDLRKVLSTESLSVMKGGTRF